MEIIKTICPRCFKIFNVPSDEGIDKVKCNFCEYEYELPKLIARGSKKLRRWYFMIWDICKKCLQTVITQDSEFAVKCPGCETLFGKGKEVSSNKGRDRNQ